jgi:beta-mannosidase
MKGANYIPPHSFLPEVSTENYTNLVVQAKNANMNMLRVWGGGVYADDAFYNACDANGILVWQDFMFACAMYPGDTAFLNNVKSEITDNIIRLQNHPSIAIWCGNNENDEGWHNWGWQKQFNYSKEEENQIWKDYEKLFHELIPATLNETLGENQYFYWPSSPSIGWGKKESLTQGDSHYWGVWWGKEPFEMYTQKVGRFMSEYGFQGMPPLSTFKKFTSNLNWENPSIKAHQKHPTGYETIDEYLVRDYKKPSSFDEYVYVSQLLQAEGMKTAIEAHRRAMPYCMGSLYWQLNDCWPVTSWSSIDFYGNWKAFHYQAKRSFERQLISFEEKNNIVDIFGINEDLSTFYGQLKIELIDFFGRVNWQYETSSFIHPNSSNILNSINLTTLPQLNPNHMFLKVTLDNSGQKKEGIYYFVKPKDLQLHQPDIRFEYLSNHQIKITSTTLIKNLYLETEGIFFEDNFFDVLPNEPKIIQASKEIKDLKWYSLNTIQ